MDKEFSSPLRIANRRHDCIALQICDRHEFELPNMGLVLFHDRERDRDAWVDTSSKKARKRFEDEAQERQALLEYDLQKAQVDYEQIFTDGDYIAPLMRLFKRR